MDFSYNYDYAYAMDEEIGAVFGTIYVIYYVIAGLVSLAGYILSAVGLYSIAKRRGINHPWLSWIPVVRVWILGSISDQYRYVTKGQIKSKRKILLGLEIAAVVLSVVMLVVGGAAAADLALVSMSGTEAEIISAAMSSLLGIVGIALLILVVGIVDAVFYYMALYDLYTSVNPTYSVLFTVLSVIPVTNVAEPFFIFFNRKKDLGMPPRCDVPVEPVQPQYLPPQPPVQEPWENTTEE